MVSAELMPETKEHDMPACPHTNTVTRLVLAEDEETVIDTFEQCTACGNTTA